MQGKLHPVLERLLRSNWRRMTGHLYKLTSREAENFPSSCCLLISCNARCMFRPCMWGLIGIQPAFTPSFLSWDNARIGRTTSSFIIYVGSAVLGPFCSFHDLTVYQTIALPPIEFFGVLLSSTNPFASFNTPFSRGKF